PPPNQPRPADRKKRRGLQNERESPSRTGITELGYALNSKREKVSALSGQRIGCGRLLGNFPPQSAGAFAARACPPEYDRRGDKDRGISSNHHPDDNRQRKIAQDC